MSFGSIPDPAVPALESAQLTTLLGMLGAEFAASIAPAEMPRAVTEFILFAEDFLDRNRPAAISQHVDRNYAISLTNGQTFLIAPPVENPAPSSPAMGF